MRAPLKTSYPPDPDDTAVTLAYKPGPSSELPYVKRKDKFRGLRTESGQMM